MPIVSNSYLSTQHNERYVYSYHDSWLANIFESAKSIAMESIQGACPIYYTHNTRVSEYSSTGKKNDIIKP